MIPNAKPLSNGLVIMFEGIDGAGKTTQLELARKALEAAGWPVVVTRNLGGTPIGEELRKVIKSPLKRPPMTDFYISLGIQEPLLGVIDSARAEGKIILMDRGPLSLAAYQIYGSGIDEKIGWQHVDNGMRRIRPEAILLYDISPETALSRIPADARSADYFESKPDDFFQRVADGYREMAERYEGVTHIDAAQGVDVIQTKTLDAIVAQLNKA